MALLAPQVVQIAGTTPSFAAANAGGDTCPAGDRTFLYVKNGGGTSITVTLTTPGTVAGLAIADDVVTVPTGADRIIGPLGSALFGDPVAIVYSAVTSVTVAAFSI